MFGAILTITLFYIFHNTNKYTHKKKQKKRELLTVSKVFVLAFVFIAWNDDIVTLIIPNKTNLTRQALLLPGHTLLCVFFKYQYIDQERICKGKLEEIMTWLFVK